MRYLATLALILGWAQAGYAADIRLTPAKSADDYAFIYFRGRIAPGDSGTFADTTKGVRNAIVFLSSPGGSATPAINIGKSIRARGFHTAVVDATCSSACALIWLAGARRYVGASSRIGFHSARWTNVVASDYQFDPNTPIEAYLRGLGYPRKTFLYVTEADSKSMKWMGEREEFVSGIRYDPLPLLKAVKAD